MGLSRREREQRRQRARVLLADYAKAHSASDVKRHVAAQRYPSGRWSRGGANRSSSMKREIRRHTIVVALCPSCGGVTPEVAALTSLFTLCSCPS